MLKACTPPHEVGPTTDRNAAGNRAIFWLLWDTDIRLAELCDLRLSNFDRTKGVIIMHGKGDKERRIALGRNALRTLLLYIDRYRPNREELIRIGNTNEQHVFLSERGFPLTRRGIDMLFIRIRERANRQKTSVLAPTLGWNKLERSFESNSWFGTKHTLIGNSHPRYKQSMGCRFL